MEESMSTWNCVKTLSESINLAANSEFENRPCEEKDFIDFTPQAEEKLYNLLKQLKIQSNIPVKNCGSADIKKCIAAILLACGEHDENNTWSSECTQQLSKEIQNVTCHLCCCENIKQVVCSVFKQCLIILRTKLVRDIWRNYPAAVASFQWLLLKVEMPQLGEYIADIFPATLLILDDFDVQNKIIGCNLMQHIITNVTRAEMRRHQYDDVVYDVLHRLTYQRDAELVVPLVNCLSTLLSRMDSSFTQNLEISRLDKSLLVLMGQMEMEQGLALRQAYVACLPLMLDAGGLSLLRWSQRLLRIFAEYLSIEDSSQGQTQLYTLQAVHCFIQHTWPRISNLSSQILTILLKLLIDITEPQSSLITTEATRQQLKEHTSKCLMLIAVGAPEQCSKHLLGAENLPFSSQFLDVISQVQQQCKEKE